MIKKEEVLAKLDALKAYTIAQDSGNKSYFTALMAPMYTAVNTYFDTHNPEFDSTLKLVVFNMYCHTVDLTTEYDDGLERDVATNIPQYYNDLREIYYNFPILSVSNKSFFDAWVYGSVTDGGSGTSANVPKSNQYVATFISDVSTAQETELERLKGLLNWLETASDLSLVEVLENTGRVTKSLSTQEIGTIIYRDRGVKEIITDKGYSVYIPTYMRG